MIKFDFTTYVKDFINQEDYNKLIQKKHEIFEKLETNSMAGWIKTISKEIIEDIRVTADYIKKNYDCLVVIGIGGSFLGSYSFDKMFQNYFNNERFEVIYAGTTLSSKYLDELLSYLKNKNFCINVISKSGSTMETTITYQLVKNLLQEKYSDEEVKNRIIITTDKEKGPLREEVNQKHYKSYEIPEDIGGRYSFMTPAHLLPLALNHDIERIVDGYYAGQRLADIAFEYSITRVLLFKNQKYIENFCVYEENLSSFTEWLKQLFGETEGKEGLGIYPTSTIHTRDLHSLGQFIQEGNKIIFETFIKVTNSDNYLEYKGQDIHTMNNIVLNSVMKAHYKGGVPCLLVEVTEIDEETISSLVYFFQLSAAFSGFLFGVDPFNQPGVEVYKQEVKNSLNNR